MAIFKTAENININYQIFTGLAPTNTFFIHGNLASNRWWMPTVEILKSQNNNLPGNVICAEFRGCGDSSVPQSESEVTMKNFARDC